MSLVFSALVVIKVIWSGTKGDLSLTTEDWESLPKLSLREAAMKSNPKNDCLQLLGASARQCAQQYIDLPARNVEFPTLAKVTKGASARIRIEDNSSVPHTNTNGRSGSWILI